MLVVRYRARKTARLRMALGSWRRNANSLKDITIEDSSPEFSAFQFNVQFNVPPCATLGHVLLNRQLPSRLFVPFSVSDPTDPVVRTSKRDRIPGESPKSPLNCRNGCSRSSVSPTIHTDVRSHHKRAAGPPSNVAGRETERTGIGSSQAVATGVLSTRSFAS